MANNLPNDEGLL